MPRGQAVLEGVEPDSRLSFRGPGAGGFLGVAAVGREFGGAEHGSVMAGCERVWGQDLLF